MKTLYLFLFLCLAGLVVAEEAPIEEVKINPLLSVKEQFSKARKKGWDFSEVERMKATDRHNEAERNLKPPKNKTNSR